MNPYTVLKKPLLSERSNDSRESRNVYTFYVDMAATKQDVEKAFMKVFEVKPLKVNTSILRGKLRRKGVNVGLTKKRKKAFVTLEASEKLSIFEEN